jgi:prepilin-type N-terminal cleavage/methylation domain-containing protein
MKKSMEEKDQGFTLIELLVVIVIVGILAAIAIPVFLSQREKAVDASMESDLKAMATAQESFYTDGQEYTETVADPDLEFTATEGNTVTVTVAADGKSFCADIVNDDDKGSGASFWYDSADGGLHKDDTGAGSC